MTLFHSGTTPFPKVKVAKAIFLTQINITALSFERKKAQSLKMEF